MYNPYEMCCYCKAHKGLQVVLDKFADDVGSDSPRGARFALDLADVIVEQGVFTAQDVYRKRFTVLGHPDDLFTEEQLDRLFELLREFAPTYK